MEAVRSSETSINVYNTTRCNIPEDSRVNHLYFFPNKISGDEIEKDEMGRACSIHGDKKENLSRSHWVEGTIWENKEEMGGYY
jgi:hypothetical protein